MILKSIIIIIDFINKYLKKVIYEYIDYKLPFEHELKKYTIILLLELNRWWFYDKYAINQNEGFRSNLKYLIGKLNEQWMLLE